MNHFSLPAFKTPLLVFSLTVWLWCAYMWISKFTLHGPLWTSWIYWLKLFIKFGKLLTLISSNILSDPFTLSFASGTPITYIFLLLMVSYISLIFWLFSFILFFFSCFRLDNLSWPVFKFTDIFSSANANLLLSLYFGFLLLDIIIFSFRITIWSFFYKFYLLIDIVYMLILNSHTFFNFLDTVSFSSFHILIIGDLTPF